MGKKLLGILVVLVTCVLALPAAFVGTLAAEGVPAVEITPDYSWYSEDASEYTIESVAQLAALGKLTQANVILADRTTFTKTDFAGKTVKLIADIAFADDQFLYYKDGAGAVYDYRIGNFAGTFDGAKNVDTGETYTISGLKFFNSVINYSTNMYLFSEIKAEGCIKNLTLDGVSANINGYDHFGFVAKTMRGTAINCHVKNVEVYVAVADNNNGYVSTSGALFGAVSSATVSNCSAQGIRFTCVGNDNTDCVGALIGSAGGTTEKRSIISNCHVKNVIYDYTRKTKRTGGFVGSVSNTDMVDCTATDINISVDNYYQGIGGFVGKADGNSTYTNCGVKGFVMTCGNTATIAGDVGGFAGLSGSNVKFENCSVADLDLDLISDNNGWGNGGFLGWQDGSGVIVDDCSVSGDITVVGKGNGVSTGGFVGYSNNASIEIRDCSSNANISTNGTAGGFVGFGKGGSFANCASAGNVTSTDGVATGLVGYLQSGAEIALVGENALSADITGIITNEVAISPSGEYVIAPDETVSFTPVSYLCHGNISGVNIGFLTMQEAVNAGANKVTLLANSTESFTLDRTMEDNFTLELGAFTYNGVVVVPHEIGSFGATGTGEGSSIVLTEPFKDHHLFNGWCNGTDNQQNIAPETADGWLVTVGQVYHTHFTESSYEHLTAEELHPDFGEMTYGDLFGSKKITFVKKDASDADCITGFVAEAGYFDISYQGLTLTISPKANLDVGTYEEIIHVGVSDGSTHGVTAKVTVKKSQAVIHVDTSDMVVISGREWRLPSASSKFGVVKVDKSVDDMKAIGVYTVTYSVEGTDNYEGDSVQIKVTVIVDPAKVQENLDQAIEELHLAIGSKASTAELEAAIDSLEAAYQAADALIKHDLAELVAGDADMAASIAALEASLATVKDELLVAIKAVEDNLDKAVAELAAKDNELQDRLEAETDALNGRITVLIVILAIVGVISVGGAVSVVVVFASKRKEQ